MTDIPVKPDVPSDEALRASGEFPDDVAAPDGDELVAAAPLKKPDITPVQIVSGIPIVAELLHAFGVYDLRPAQVDSLEKTATWAIALLGADAIIRLGRNLGQRLR
jgi:hypothetical protein